MPGDIFRRRTGTKMREYTEQELVDSLQFVEVLKLDKDGNLIIKKVY